MFPLWYAPIYTDGLSPEARFPRDRYRMVRAGLEREASNIVFHEPERITQAELELAHCPDYTQRFLDGALREKEIRRIGLKPWTEDMVERTLMLTEGTIAATRHVLAHGGFAGNIGGGTHHGYYDFGSGYCIFNDLAIAAMIALRDYGVGRVLILDLDVHQGDGTAAIFSERQDPIRTVSFHCAKNFPFRKTQSDLDVSLPPGTTDEQYLEHLATFLEEEPARFEPDLILYQAGVDILATDRLGKFVMTRSGAAQRNDMVFAFARQRNLPLVVTMGGGYGQPIDTSVAAHVDLFRSAAGGS